MTAQAGYLTSHLYLLIGESRGRHYWALFAADQHTDRVFWGRRLANGHATSRAMAASAGRIHATQHVHHHRARTLVGAG